MGGQIAARLAGIKYYVPGIPSMAGIKYYVPGIPSMKISDSEFRTIPETAHLAKHGARLPILVFPM